MSFAPSVVAIAGAERGGAGDAVELALTCHAEAEVIPAAGSRAKENPR
jgi:hypothetical protein